MLCAREVVSTPRRAAKNGRRIVSDREDGGGLEDVSGVALGVSITWIGCV